MGLSWLSFWPIAANNGMEEKPQIFYVYSSTHIYPLLACRGLEVADLCGREDK
jgi:hypothetical protein